MNFDYPYWQTPLAQQASLLNVALVLAAGALCWAVWYAYRERSLWPVFVFLGGGLCVLYEPLGDVLTAVAYPPGDAGQAFEAFGRFIPLWMVPNYFFFISVPLFVITRYLIEKNVSLKVWMISFLGVALFMGCFEQPGINVDAWRYYAQNYPVTINTYPVWIAFANAQSAIVVATAVYCLRRFVLPAPFLALLVLLMPAIFTASHVGASLFVAAAQYSTLDTGLINVAALVAIAVCFINVWISWKILSLARGRAA